MTSRAVKLAQTMQAREKIKTVHLIRRLNSFALSEDDENGPVKMTESQVRAAIALLKKTVPDLQSIELNGNVAVTHEQALDEVARALKGRPRTGRPPQSLEHDVKAD